MFKKNKHSFLFSNYLPFKYYLH